MESFGQLEPTCCAAGFAATTGWDPVTGLGSIRLPQLVAMLLAVDRPDYVSSEELANRDRRIVLIIVIVIFIVLGVLGLLYYYYYHRRNRKATQQTTVTANHLTTYNVVNQEVFTIQDHDEENNK